MRFPPYSMSHPSQWTNASTVWNWKRNENLILNFIKRSDLIVFSLTCLCHDSICFDAANSPAIWLSSDPVVLCEFSMPSTGRILCWWCTRCRAACRRIQTAISPSLKCKYFFGFGFHWINLIWYYISNQKYFNENAFVLINSRIVNDKIELLFKKQEVAPMPGRRLSDSDGVESSTKTTIVSNDDRPHA